MRRAGLTFVGAAALPVAVSAVLVAEWKLAKRGPQLPPGDVAEEGPVGGAGTALRLVWLGDSTVTGPGASSVEATLPHLVARALDRPVEVVIRAASGSRVADVAGVQALQVHDLDPDAVIVCVGTNDALYRTPLAEVRRSCEQLLAVLPAVPVIVVGPTDMGAVARLLQPLRFLLGVSGRRTAGAIRAAAEDAGAHFVDLAAVVGPAVRRDPDRFLAVDRFHSSDESYALIATAILERLRPALATVQAAAVDGDR